MIWQFLSQGFHSFNIITQFIREKVLLHNYFVYQGESIAPQLLCLLGRKFSSTTTLFIREKV